MLTNALDFLNGLLGCCDVATVSTLGIIGIGALGLVIALVTSWLPDRRAQTVSTAFAVVLALGLAGQIVVQATNLPVTSQLVALLASNATDDQANARDTILKGIASAKRSGADRLAARETPVRRTARDEAAVTPFETITGSIGRPAKKAAAAKSREVDEAKLARAVNGMSRHLRNVYIVIADDPEARIYAARIAAALGRQDFSVGFEEITATAAPAGVVVCARQPADQIVFRVARAAGIATRAIGSKDKNWADVCDPATAAVTAHDEIANALLTTGSIRRAPQKATRIFVGQPDQALAVTVQRQPAKRVAAQDPSIPAAPEIGQPF